MLRSTFAARLVARPALHLRLLLVWRYKEDQVVLRSSPAARQMRYAQLVNQPR